MHENFSHQFIFPEEYTTISGTKKNYYIPRKTRHITATVTSEKKDIGEPSTADDLEKYVSRTPLKFKTGGISTQVIDIFLKTITS